MKASCFSVLLVDRTVLTIGKTHLEEAAMKDVVVLGGGAGGVPAAIRAAQLGGQVAIVEENVFGGLCMNRACVPFRHMMLASDILGGLSFGDKLGLSSAGVGKDFPALRKRQEELIAFMRMGVATTLKKNKVEIIQGRGKVAGKGKVEVNGQMVPCKNIILATGSTWARPPFPGGDLAGVLNGDGLLGADALPKSALLFGASPWLLEVAQFLQRFGSDVILATPEKALLPQESKTIETRLRKALQGQGMAVRREAAIAKVSKEKGKLQVALDSRDGSESHTVEVVFYMERGPSLENLGLESVGLNSQGDCLKVNERMETQVEGIYAIGDLIGPPTRQYSHYASETAIAAAGNAMGLRNVLNPHTFTRVLFTQPQVACVGLTPKEAKEAGYEVVVGAAPFGMNPYGMLLAENEGIVELVADKKYGELLGGHFIGSHVSEMAGQIILAIQMEATLEELARVSCPHPTLSESIAEAARNALGRHIYLP